MSKLTVSVAACESVIANTSFAPGASCTSVSAIESSGSSGPSIVAVVSPDSGVPSGVQIAFAALQPPVVAWRLSVTSLCPEGRIPNIHRSNDPGTARRLLPTVPPVTCRASWIAWFLSNDSLPSNTASLKASSTLNALAPSWDAGAFSNDAASPGGSAGARVDFVPGAAYGTCAANPVVSMRPLLAQSAPSIVQARLASMMRNTTSVPVGVSVISQRSSLMSTRAAEVTVAPVTVSAWSRIFSGVMSTSSLKSMRNVNAEPSWLAGKSLSSAVSGYSPCAIASHSGFRSSKCVAVGCRMMNPCRYSA